MHLEIIAFFAGLISSTAAIPQIYHMIKTRKTGAVSTFMFAMKNVSNSLWVAFGFATGVYSVIFWNIISFCLCSTVIIMKHRIIKQKELEKAIKHEAEKLAHQHEAHKFIEHAVHSKESQYYIPKRPGLRLVYSASSQA
jgi:MtN3 and saliva related transmembrane protein